MPHMLVIVCNPKWVSSQWFLKIQWLVVQEKKMDLRDNHVNELGKLQLSQNQIIYSG